MLKVLLFAASLLSAQEASMQCSNIATAQTQAVGGPAGVAAVLKVSSGDDHSKNSHDCLADYQLLVLPGSGGASDVTQLLSSDGAWGRRLSVHLDGFSHDGKRVFGILSEGGRPPMAMLFGYNIVDHKVQLLDLTKALRQIGGAKCGSSPAVAGTIDSGEIVLGSDPASRCRTRWFFDSTTSTWQPLPQGKSVLALFKYRVVAP
jgi:hypothetical protein